MSNLAYARPRGLPEREEHQHPRHVEIVATRDQKRRRPKVVYAVATIGSLFVIFAAQLLLSIAVADGAYQIDSLQVEQKGLIRTQDALTEQLDLLASTQHLAANAAHLGMVPGTSPLFLDLQNGAVASAPGSVDRPGCGGTCGLIANSLLTGVPLVDSTPVATQSTTGTTPPPAVTTPPAGTVDALPAPVTH